MARRHDRDQVRGLEYPNFKQMASVRVFKRIHRRNGRRDQAAIRPRHPPLGQQQPASDAHEADLVDTFWLMMFPVILGTGKRLFFDGALPAAFKLTESTIAPNGVIIANYERAGQHRVQLRPNSNSLLELTMKDDLPRRSFIVNGLVTASLLGTGVLVNEERANNLRGREIKLDAKPEPIVMDPARTALIVVDMQSDFGSNCGMFHRAGIDITGIQKAIAPTAAAIASARHAGIGIIYLKMGYRADLSDLGARDSVNRARHMRLGVGKAVKAPDGRD